MLSDCPCNWPNRLLVLIEPDIVSDRRPGRHRWHLHMRCAFWGRPLYASAPALAFCSQISCAQQRRVSACPPLPLQTYDNLGVGPSISISAYAICIQTSGKVQAHRAGPGMRGPVAQQHHGRPLLPPSVSHRTPLSCCSRSPC